MRRRSFLKALVAAGAGCLALAPKAVHSIGAGTLEPAWTKEEQQAWTPEDIDSIRERLRVNFSVEPADETWNLEFAATPMRTGFRVVNSPYYAPRRTHADL